VQYRNVVQFIARLFMPYNRGPFFFFKRGGDNHEGKVDDVQHIFRQLSFLKERKGSVWHTATEKALHIS